MQQNYLRVMSTTAALGALVALAACGNDNSTNPPASTSTYAVTDLVADASTTADASTVDEKLINAWGVAFGPTGFLWVANAETGTSTVYDAAGAKQPLTVTIPSASSATGGAPTGVLYNATADFTINGGAPAAFIFAGEDGTIAAWSSGMSSAVKVADRSSNDAVYKGLAVASDGGTNHLYATNFKGNAIDVFDAGFAYVKSFTDPSIPAGYGPFGIQNIDGDLYVSFAKQLAPDNEDDEAGPGLGYIVIFHADGTVSKRFASGGNLNAPWAIVRAPAGFGDVSGAILVGNFGDGKIGAYSATSGEFMGFLKGENGDALVIDGLWGLTFGPASSPSTLYFASGPDDETHGLVGKINLISQ
ncbi:MAG: TIGR03118 family protein [Gemmatimonadaceae bacterium]